jgi:hypothetical protein
MTRRMKAKHDFVDEAGLLSPTTFCFALSLPCISFASLASVVFAGWELMADCLFYDACWPLLEWFEYFACVEYQVCDLPSDEVYQSLKTRLTPLMVRNSIPQHSFL